MHIALGSRRPGRSVVNQSSANTARKTPSQFILREEKKGEKPEVVPVLMDNSADAAC